MEARFKPALRASLAEDCEGIVNKSVRAALEKYLDGCARYLSRVPPLVEHKDHDRPGAQAGESGKRVNSWMTDEFLCPHCRESVRRRKETCPQCGTALEWEADGDGRSEITPGEGRAQTAYIKEDIQILVTALDCADAAAPVILRIALKRFLSRMLELLDPGEREP